MRWLSAEYRLAALAFIVSVVYVPTIFSAPYMPRWWALAIGLPLLCILIPRNIDRVIGSLLFLGVAWASLQFLYIEDAFNAILPFYFLIISALVFVAASNVSNITPVLIAFGWGVGLSSIVSGLQYFGLYKLLGAAYGGFFYNTEVLAEIAAPLFVWAIVSKRWVLALVLSVALAVSQSRIGIMAACLGLVWVYGPRSLVYRAIGAVALLLGAFLAITLLSGKFGSIDHRLTLWIAAIYSITFFGNGLGWWKAAHPFGFEEFVHSDLLQFLVELGIGGVFFIAIPVLIFANGIRDKALAGCFLVLCFESVVSFPTHVPATAFLLFCVAGFLARSGTSVRDTERAGGILSSEGLRRETPYRAGVAAYGSDYRRILWD